MLHPDAPPLAGQRAEALGRMAALVLTPGVSPEVVMAGTAVNGWRLEETRLMAAVNHFAPGVTVSKRN